MWKTSYWEISVEVEISGNEVAIPRFRGACSRLGCRENLAFWNRKGEFYHLNK